ncbi:MAG: carboxypeptidase-like regulatory domain-containing protein [Candidatus Eremiobacterota bacterium]
MRLSFNVILLIIAIFSLLVYLPVMLFGCGSSSDIDVGSIQGTLVDTGGTIMAGKKIKIQGINGIYGLGIVDTNVYGKFSFTNIPTGTYTITASEQDGTFIASKNVDITKNETEQVTIQQGEVAPPTPTPSATNTPGGTVTATPTFIEIFSPTPTFTPAYF